MRKSISTLAMAAAFCVGFTAVDTARAATVVTSSNFSLAFGFTGAAATGTWNTTENNGGVNVNGTTISLGSGFSILPNVSGTGASGFGPTFTGRTLGNTSSSNTTAGSGRSENFSVSLTGSYDAGAVPLPAGATNVQITLNITQLSVYALAYRGTGFATTPNTLSFHESTVGHNSDSTAVTLGTTTSNANFRTGTNFTQLVWDAPEFAVAGTTSLRTFNLSSFGTATWLHDLEGVEILGNVSISYDLVTIPEPGAAAVMGLGVIGAALRRNRKA